MIKSYRVIKRTIILYLNNLHEAKNCINPPISAYAVTLKINAEALVLGTCHTSISYENTEIELHTIHIVCTSIYMRCNLCGSIPKRHEGTAISSMTILGLNVIANDPVVIYRGVFQP